MATCGATGTVSDIQYKDLLNREVFVAGPNKPLFVLWEADAVESNSDAGHKAA